MLREHLSLLGEGNLHINESLDFDVVLRTVIDGARPQRIMLKYATIQGAV